MATVYLYDHRGYTRLTDVQPRHHRFSWHTQTPAADLRAMHLALRPWHVSGNLYALSPDEAYATLLRKFPAIARSNITGQDWLRMGWQLVYGITMMFAVIIAGIIFGVLASLVLSAIIAAVASFFRQ